MMLAPFLDLSFWAILFHNLRMIPKFQMDATTAQQTFDALISEQSDTCLWFLRDAQSLSVESPTAETVLSAIIRHGNRDALQKPNGCKHGALSIPSKRPTYS